MDAFPVRRLRGAALLVAVGALLSGPVSMLVLSVVAPQPGWAGAAVFAEHYRPIQALPYVLGFVLLTGFVLFTAGCHRHAPPAYRTRTSASLVFTSVYAAMVFTNYMLQVGVVPRLMASEPGLVAGVTMANPSSLGWFLEMFGYAALGVAMGLVAPLFRGSRRRDWIRWLLVADAVLSVAGAVFTALYDRWFFSSSGLASFFVWNLVVIVCFGLIAAEPE